MNLDTSMKWNLAHREQSFGSRICHACSAVHFLDEAFMRTVTELGESFAWHRKVWEFATIAEIGRNAKTSFGLNCDAIALGFGVGREPLSSFFASLGYVVVATDQPEATAAEWAKSNEYSANLEDLWKDSVIDEATFSSQVSFRAVDMNNLPNDLPLNHLMWSSCVIEHLGGLNEVLEFFRSSAKLLLPGGTMIHTTELELLSKSKMSDYGNCAVFRPEDLMQMFNVLIEEGLEVLYSFHVPCETYQDSHISTPPYSPDEPHLKLSLIDSISTSFAIVATRPKEIHAL